MNRYNNFSHTLYTYIWIFAVGRGLSICLRTPQNWIMQYDLGCSDDFSPLSFIKENILPFSSKYIDYEKKENKFAQLILSHPHSDHIAEISEEEINNIKPGLLTCPHDKESDVDEKVNFRRVNNPDSKKYLIDVYKKIYSERRLPLQTITNTKQSVPNQEYGIFYMRPPECEKLYPTDDQSYTNALSIIFYYKHGDNTLLIPGDIPPLAFEEILRGKDSVERRYTYFDLTKMIDDMHLKTGNQPILGDLLEKGLTILVTPHHGLESGFCPLLYDFLGNNIPLLNIISDKRSDLTSGKVDNRYYSEETSKGMQINMDGNYISRRSVSTKDGYHILVIFKGNYEMPIVFLRKNPLESLDIVP